MVSLSLNERRGERWTYNGGIVTKHRNENIYIKPRGCVEGKADSGEGSEGNPLLFLVLYE